MRPITQRPDQSLSYLAVSGELLMFSAARLQSHRARAGLRLAAANLLAVAGFALLALSPAVASADVPTWQFDLYNSRGAMYQDPDYTACVATNTEMMLNMTTYQANLGYLSSSNEVFQLPMRWRPTTSTTEQAAILAYARANMTMLTSSAGSDPHGWRNALNYFGWGKITAGVYRDSSYTSFDSATRAVVSALAWHEKPVGLLALAGRHAQMVTGYVVTGGDPAVSTDYTIVGVYITDSLQSAAMRDAYVPLATWQSGATAVRFTPYLETDSPYQDPIDGQVGRTEWYGKWVIIDALR
jgi:hypothetical protein